MARRRILYASKCGAGIFNGPCSRFDALYTFGMYERCLTFPTTRMDAAINRFIAYMAQTSSRGITYVTVDPLAPRDVLRGLKGLPR